MIWSGFGHADTIILTAVDGGLFNLTSFDGAEAPFNITAPQNWASGIQVDAVSNDNSLTAAIFTLDQLNDGTGGIPDFQSFVTDFSGGFKEFRFSGISGNGRDFAIDNLNVVRVSVPEPATIAILGLGLLGFAASRRKSAKSRNA